MTQFALKMIALVAMLLDHTAKVVLTSGTLAPLVGMEQAIRIRTAMLVLGRMAFPIFAWFAAEGCRKTSSSYRHLARMLIFGILSEIPFQLCFYGGVAPGAHNVIFTFLLASGAICAGQWMEKRRVPAPAARILPAVAAMALGWVLHTDYNAWGVGLVLALYYMPTEKGRLIVLGSWVTVFQLLWHGWNGTGLSWLSPSGSVQLLYWLGAVAAVALLACYNGQRGPKCKWLFYIFYPSHLLILYLIAAA